MNRAQIIPVALLLGWSASAQAQNLLSNPGFENANPGDYWQIWVMDTTTMKDYAALTFPNTGAHEGTRYAQVEVKTPASENWHIQLQIPPDWIADSGATYELKFWARSDSSTGIHVGIQDGPDNNYTYRSGMDFQLSPEWTEETVTYTSDRKGNGALRFNLYLGRFQDTYGFDGFSLQQQSTAIRGGTNPAGRSLRVRQGAGSLILALEGGASEAWKAELFDLRGKGVAAAAGRTGGPLILPQPRERGTYLLRASTARGSWIRKVSVGLSPHSAF